MEPTETEIGTELKEVYVRCATIKEIGKDGDDYFVLFEDFPIKLWLGRTSPKLAYGDTVKISFERYN